MLLLWLLKGGWQKWDKRKVNLKVVFFFYFLCFIVNGCDRFQTVERVWPNETKYRAVSSFLFFFFPLQGWRGIHSGVQIKPNCQRNSIRKNDCLKKKWEVFVIKPFIFFFFLRSQFESLHSFGSKVNDQTGFPVPYLAPLHWKNAKIPILRIYSFYHWISLNVATGSYLLKLEKKKKYQLKML